MFVVSQEGRFLYISETVSIYLGLSQVRHTHTHTQKTPVFLTLIHPLCSIDVHLLFMGFCAKEKRK